MKLLFKLVSFFCCSAVASDGVCVHAAASPGVLVLDRVNGVAYVALSERADKELAEQWVRHGGTGWLFL